MYTIGELADELNRYEWAVIRMLKNRGYLKQNGEPRKSTIDDGLMNKNGLIKEYGWSFFIDELGYKESDDEGNDSDEYEDSDNNDDSYNDNDDSDEYEDSDDDDDSYDDNDDSDEYEDSDDDDDSYDDNDDSDEYEDSDDDDNLYYDNDDSDEYEGSDDDEDSYDSDEDEEPYFVIQEKKEKAYKNLSEEEKKEFVYNEIKPRDYDLDGFWYLIKIAFDFDDSIELWDEEDQESYPNPWYYMREYICEMAEKHLCDAYYDDFQIFKKHFGYDRSSIRRLFSEYEEEGRLNHVLLALDLLGVFKDLYNEKNKNLDYIDFLERQLGSGSVYDEYKKDPTSKNAQKIYDRLKYYARDTGNNDDDYDGPDSDWYPNGPNDAEDFPYDWAGD